MPSDQWTFLSADEELPFDRSASERSADCGEEAALHIEERPPDGVADPGSADVSFWTPAGEVARLGLAAPFPDEQPEWDGSGSTNERDDERADLEDLLIEQHYA